MQNQELVVLDALPGDPAGLERLRHLTADLTRRLTLLPTFAAFNLRELTALAEVMELTRCKPRTQLNQPGQPTRFAWLVLEGNVHYALALGDGQQPLREALPGDWLLGGHALSELPVPGVWQAQSACALVRIAVGRLQQMRASKSAVAAKFLLALRAQTGRDLQQVAECMTLLARV